MVAFLAATGCNANTFPSQLAGLQSGAASGNSELVHTREIDAGIIFAGQASYLCLPLTELGLDGVRSASDIATVTTSCECVQASLLSYHHSSSRVEEALRLDFTPDEPTDGAHRPSHLAVEVTLTLTAGSQRSLRLNVLETQAVVHAPTSNGSDHDQDH